MDDKQAFFVQSSDGRKFKMVIRGDLGKLSVGKIRRYLKSYGVPEGQVLLYNGMVLEDDEVGDNFGLSNNTVLQLASPSHAVGDVDMWSKKTNDTFSQALRNDYSATISSAANVELPDHRLPSASFRTQTQTEALTNHIDPENILSVRSTTCSAPAVTLPGNNNKKRDSGKNNNDKNNNNTNVGVDVALEIENQQLREEVQRLRQELSDLQERSKRPVSMPRYDPASVDLLHNAKANLQELAEELGIPLQFDMNFTCVIGTDENHTVLVTFDQATERLYAYSTLLTQLPEDSAVRVKLYELLLEGSLLGREVCGGGIGTSLQSGIVLLSTTIPLRHCSSSALKDIMPSFVETLGRWRSLINDLVE